MVGWAQAGGFKLHPVVRHKGRAYSTRPVA